jgi:hypothetical protein
MMLKQGENTMLEDGLTPYGKERHQQMIADAERRRLINSLPNRQPSLPTRIIRTTSLALAALIGR